MLKPAIATMLAVAGLALTAHAQTKTWDGDAGTLDWKDDANWNPDGEPELTDDVLVDAGGSVFFQTGTLEFAGGMINSGLTLDSSSMDVLFDLDVTNLIAQGCCTVELATSGALKIRGNSLFANPVRHTGPGTTTIFDLTTANNAVRVDAHTLTIDGTLFVTTAMGALQTWNNGTVIVNGNVVLDADTETGQVNGGFIDNKGTIGVLSEGTATLAGDVRTNGGRLAATNGDLDCTGLYPFTSGRVEAYGTGFVNLRGSGDVDFSNVTFAGDGSIEWRNGTTRIAGDCKNEVEFPGDLTFRGNTNLTGTLTNTGNMVFLGATLTGGGSITGSGFTTVTSGGIIGVPFTISSGGSLESTSAFTLDHDLVIDDGGIAFLGGDIGDRPDAIITNSGLIKPSDEVQFGDFVRVRPPLDLKPGGRLSSDEGVLSIEGGGFWSGGTLDPAPLTGKINLTRKAINVTGDVIFAGHVTIGDALSPPEFGLAISGSVRAQPPQDEFVGLNADLTGDGVFINEGLLFMSRAPRLGCRIENDGDISLSSSPVIAAAFENRALVTHGSGDVRFEDGSVNNAGDWRVESSARYHADQGIQFVNAAEFLGLGEFSPISVNVDVGFDNSGIVRADNATMSFASVAQIQNGILNGGIWLTENEGKILFPGSDIFTVFGDGTRVRGDGDKTPWIEDIGAIEEDALVQLDGDTDMGEVDINGGRMDVVDGTVTANGIGVRDSGVLGIGPNAVVESTNEVVIESVVDQIQGVINLALGPGEPGTIIAPSVLCNGIIDPHDENATAPLNFETVLTLTPTANILVDVAAQETDVISIDGSATLDGTLTANLVGTFEPPIGASFDVLHATEGFTGRFAGVASPVYGPDGAKRRLRASYGLNTIGLVVACGADLSGAGDPNDPAYGVPDGRVDATDFFYFLDQFAAGNLAEADLTGSGDPDDPEYLVPNGVIDATDFFVFLDLFVQGCE